MKNKNLLFLLLGITIFSCKKDDEVEAIQSSEDQIAIEIAALPEINGLDVEQLPFSKLEVTLTDKNNNASNHELFFNYYNNGKIESVLEKEDTLYQYSYSTDRVTLHSPSDSKFLYLMENGIADSLQGLTNQFKYYFKNDYFLRTTENSSLRMEYSTDGNLTHYQNGSLMADYTYIDSTTNNIRQEVLSPLTYHWSFRDLYLGKFSSNLIETATFVDSSLGNYTYTLNFSYEFDELERVSKVIINRQTDEDNSLIEYSIAY